MTPFGTGSRGLIQIALLRKLTLLDTEAPITQSKRIRNTRRNSLDGLVLTHS